MERLTFEGDFCDIAKCAYRACPHDLNCTQKQVWERLKQFEDAFGTPEKAERVKLAFMGKSVYEIKEFNGVPLARLIELAEADKDGRVVVLPCKVGHRVFALLDTDKHISECEVKQIGLGNEIGFVGIEPIGARGREYGVSLNGFGKTVFLSREEAEKALQKMQGKEKADGTTDKSE